MSKVEDNVATFDYIVVGSGAAGSVVASGLAEHGNKVLVLEAGGYTQEAVGGQDFIYKQVVPPHRRLTYFDVPQQWWYVCYYPENGYTWNITENGFVGLKGVGGTGVANAMIFFRGLPHDFKNWNITGWSFEEVLHYYKQIEKFEGKPDASRGTQGPITVSYPAYLDKEGQLFIESAKNSGFHYSEDLNHAGENRVNKVSQFQLNINDGVRSSSAAEILAPALEKYKGSLELRVNSQVTKILFENSQGHPPKAVGVEYDFHGQVVRVYARKEVIVSAGTVNTPKLLLLSGIGPKSQLQQFHIPLVAEVNGVGKNVQDHFRVNLAWESGNSVYPNQFAFDIPQFQYVNDKKGPWATPGFSTVGFWRSDPGSEVSDIQYTFIPRIFDRTADPLAKPGITVSITLQHHEARGTISLTSGDWRAPPSISRFAGTNAKDNNILVKAIHKLREIFKQEPLGGFVGPEVLPGSQVSSEQQVYDFVAKNAEAMGHWSGSSKMGNFATDSEAVVDERLRVRGVTGLRVADASIMPFVTHGNVHGTVLAIGAKAVDLILADHAHHQKGNHK